MNVYLLVIIASSLVMNASVWSKRAPVLSKSAYARSKNASVWNKRAPVLSKNANTRSKNAPVWNIGASVLSKIAYAVVIIANVGSMFGYEEMKLTYSFIHSGDE